MTTLTRVLLTGAILGCLTMWGPQRSTAQVPVAVPAVQPMAPAVVGYVPERRGLFGWRVGYRPVVMPAATPVAPVTVGTAPIVSSGRVSVGYSPWTPTAAPVTTFYRAPAATFYQPPVTTFYQAPATTFRVPVTPNVPVWGF